MNILITGASRGIGKAIAENLIKEGYKVFVSARNEDLLKHYDNMIKEIKKYDISEKSKQIVLIFPFITNESICSFVIFAL